MTFELPTLTHAEDEDRVCFDDIELDNGERLCVDLDKYRKAKARYDRQAESLAEELIAGAIALDVWRQAMREILKELYAVTYLVGIGGVEQFDDRHGAILRDLVRNQYGYLDAWGKELESQQQTEEQAPSLAQIVARALLYGIASNAILQRAVIAALGLPDLPAYPGDGSSICRVRDRCAWRIERLNGQGNFNLFWTLDVSEHCETCLTRASVWSPLLIRNGIILPYAQLPELFA